MRCRRPERVCYCRHIVPIDTETRVVLLQHPRERDVAIGTARMASLCLTRSELHVGIDWQSSKALAKALSDPARPAALLYPGEGAINILEEPPKGPITLVVVDGTWWQTKKLVKLNPILAALPRYAFEAPQPSEYRIRREPSLEVVSTIEALAYVLGVLEKDPPRLSAMLRPFRAMVDTQLDHEARLHGGMRRKRTRKRLQKSPALPDLLRERATDLVCVVGEANAWPSRSAQRGAIYPDEIVHWVAKRLHTGEAFERVVAPQNPLAPRTSEYTRLSPAELASGATLPDALKAWEAFLKPSDIVCTWGLYASSLFAASGGRLPTETLDLRQIARAHEKRKVGTLEEYLASIGIDSTAIGEGSGRASARLHGIAEVTKSLLRAARGDASPAT